MALVEIRNLSSSVQTISLARCGCEKTADFSQRHALTVSREMKSEV